MKVSLFEPEKFWDETFSRVKNCSWQKVKEMNDVIATDEKRVEDIFFPYEHGERRNEKLTMVEFLKQYQKAPVNSDSFYNFAHNEIEKKKGAGLAPGTITSYKANLKKLNNYRPGLLFSEITREFVFGWREQMVAAGDSKNYIHQSMAYLRRALTEAVIQGVIATNPIQGIKLSKEDGTRAHLTPEELQKFEHIPDEHPLQGAMLRTHTAFLFCCYTGLRYSDVKRLVYGDLTTQLHDGRPWRFLSIRMHKTKTLVSIPLTDKAAALVGSGYPGEKIFRVSDSYRINIFLKDLAALAGINKPERITFHVSRHTFAVSGISGKIPVEVVSALLGHTDLKTTQIYSKVVDSVKVDYMAKFNQVAPVPDPKPRRLVIDGKPYFVRQTGPAAWLVDNYEEVIETHHAVMVAALVDPASPGHDAAKRELSNMFGL